MMKAEVSITRVLKAYNDALLILILCYSTALCLECLFKTNKQLYIDTLVNDRKNVHIKNYQT